MLTYTENKQLKNKSVPKNVEKFLGKYHVWTHIVLCYVFTCMYIPPLSFSLSPGPPTVEEVVVLLYNVAGQWKEIAAGLVFGEDLIDEIFTNNQTDELCLRHMVEIWVSRLAPSWETLSLALRDIGRNDLAHKTKAFTRN